MRIIALRLKAMAICLRDGHDWRFSRNIHGDEIMHRGWKRSEWRCERCKKYEYRDDLHQ